MQLSDFVILAMALVCNSASIGYPRTMGSAIENNTYALNELANRNSCVPKFDYRAFKPRGCCGSNRTHYKRSSDRVGRSNKSCITRMETLYMPRPHFGSVPYGVAISSCTVPGVVALTFDDGPSAHTSELLDMLSRESIKATFFVSGNSNGERNAEDPRQVTQYTKLQANRFRNEHLEILKRMVSEGHQVAQHCWSHQDLDSIGHEQRRQQTLYIEAALASVLGVVPTYMRPPYLSCGNECLAHLGAMGYHVIQSDLDTHDWKLDHETSKHYVHNALAKGSPSTHSYVPLMHDIFEKSVKILVPYTIDLIKRHGYRAVTVGECLLDPPKNWYRDPATGKPRLPKGSPYTNDWKYSISNRSIPFVPVSSAGLCGRKASQTCAGSSFGACCSKYSFCGSTDEYCGTGCQEEFGDCLSSTFSPNSTSFQLQFPES